MNKEIKELLLAAAKNEASVNFSAEDVQEAAKNAILEYAGLKGVDLTARAIREHKNEIFGLIEEIVDEVVPAKMTDILGAYAQVKSFGRNDQVMFHIEGLGAGRVKAAIVPGARGGVYRARRLDSRDLTIDVQVVTVGYMITLEELLTGSRSISDIINIITEGLVERVYIEVVKALRATYSTLPAKNSATHSGDAIDFKGIDKVVRTVSAYGKPLIIGFASLTDQFVNAVGSSMNPNIAGSDLDEIKNNGRVGMYKGTKVLTLPNYFLDQTNSQWLFKETDLFVLPVGAKPVLVAFKGEAYTAEVDQPHGGKEWHLHKMMGVSIVFNQNIGMYRQTGASGLDADGLY